MKKIITTLLGVIIYISISICCVGIKIAKAETNELGVSSKSALLMDCDTETIIFEKEIDKKLPIASMVKMMTIYLTLNEIEDGNLSLDKKVTISENASGMGGSQVFIDPYVSYTVENLLKSVIMSSANDSSVALAEEISGSESSFVNKMNSTAKNLGMNNTLYCNCTGLPAPEQYSTAYDCAVLLRNLIKYDLYHKYSNIWMDELVHPSGRKTELVNTNKLVKYYNGCDCGKTGSTSEAGYCLTSSAIRDNMRLICVVIGSDSGKERFKESTNLFNYGFANYENRKLISKTVVLTNVSTTRCKQKEANIVSVKDYYVFDKKGNKSSYDVSYSLPNKIGATKVGEIVGQVIVLKDGNVVEKIDLTVLDNIDGMSFKDNVFQIIENW